MPRWACCCVRYGSCRASERYLRAGKWIERRPAAERRDAARPHRRHGRHGRHRPGDRAAARCVPACRSFITPARRGPICRTAITRDLIAMARDVDTLMVIVPGGPATRNMINAEVLAALGPRGIVVNMARGSVVDEKALIAAFQNRTILSAGLDVFADEPRMPQELIAMDHVVLLPMSAPPRRQPAPRWTNLRWTTFSLGRPASRR